MTNKRALYDQNSLPLFEQFCPVDFSNIFETVICSPVVEAIGTPIQTQILQVLNNPSLKAIRSIETQYALFANQRRKLSEFGISIDTGILANNLGPGITRQIIDASNHIFQQSESVTDEHPCVSQTFEIHGVASQIPKAIVLPTQVNKKTVKTFTWRDGQSVPETSLNSIPELNMYKGLIFEYISLLTLSIIKNKHRVFRQFAPLISNGNETFRQGYRVDGYVDNCAIECKWGLHEKNFDKVEKDMVRFGKSDINMIGLSYRTINGCDLEFQTYDHLIEPLLITKFPGVSIVIAKLKELLDTIEDTYCLPANHKVLCTALYNILDQSALLYSTEKVEFIVHHLHNILEVYKCKHQLERYVEDNELNFPQMSDESSFRYKSDMYIAYTKPTRKFADPDIAMKSLSTYRGVSSPDLNLSYLQSMHPNPLVQTTKFHKSAGRHSIAFNYGQANRSQLQTIVSNLNNQQASIADIYTLFNFIRAGSHRVFLRSSHLHAFF